MIYRFSMEAAHITGASILKHNKYSISFQRNTGCKNGGIVLECAGHFSAEAKYLTAHVTSYDTRCSEFFVLFFSNEPDAELSNPDISYRVNLMPKTTADVIFELNNLDGTVRYPVLQPVTLKSHVAGTR